MIIRYRELIEGNEELSVAVRSSAQLKTFQMLLLVQQETFLNVKGIDAVIEATKTRVRFTV
ncbi:hypothetical protein O9929_11875 [Vibrio lentus]|nr:hypothetical protein [Vibrio lentus]